MFYFSRCDDHFLLVHQDLLDLLSLVLQKSKLISTRLPLLPLPTHQPFKGENKVGCLRTGEKIQIQPSTSSAGCESSIPCADIQLYFLPLFFLLPAPWASLGWTDAPALIFKPRRLRQMHRAHTYNLWDH